MAETKVQYPPGALRTERLGNGNRKLIRALQVKLDSGTTIGIPEGFETDFSSIPFLARPFLHWSRVDIAGVVHDFLYWCPQPDIDRKRADAIWREMAGAGQRRANWLQRWLGWVGLRLCGRKAHNRARAAREAGDKRECCEGDTPKREAAVETRRESRALETILD